jgi:hypothetical protein
MRRALGSVLASLALVATMCVHVLPVAAEPHCKLSTSGSTLHREVRIRIDSACGRSGTGKGSQGPPTRVYDCGPRVIFLNSTPATSEDVCRAAEAGCSVPLGTPVDPTVTTLVVMVQRLDKFWSVQRVDCAVRVNALTPLMIRAEVIRLIPAVPVRSAPVDGYTLVNTKTVLWVETPSQRPLGLVTLLGHRVQIQITAASVRWDFGDGTVDDGPLGQPFSAACATRECPAFWGHDYTRKGTPVVTATVSWTARYAVDRGAWTDLPGGVVIGALTRQQLVVREARAVLVPDPSQR